MMEAKMDAKIAWLRRDQEELENMENTIYSLCARTVAPTAVIPIMRSDAN